MPNVCWPGERRESFRFPEQRDLVPGAGAVRLAPCLPSAEGTNIRRISRPEARASATWPGAGTDAWALNSRAGPATFPWRSPMEENECEPCRKLCRGNPASVGWQRRLPGAGPASARNAQNSRAGAAGTECAGTRLGRGGKTPEQVRVFLFHPRITGNIHSFSARRSRLPYSFLQPVASE